MTRKNYKYLTVKRSIKFFTKMLLNNSNICVFYWNEIF